ncbi:MAG: pseudouridine synthase [Pseudomonadota bacterium]|nr:pseudouridine synthase [Pseudomonadota bacterium]
MEEQDGKRRLAKVMAERGIASRREAERMIEEGKVEVNGVVVSHPGHPVDAEKDRIKVDGKYVVRTPAHKVYFLLYKPKGYITGRDDPGGRTSVLELLGDVSDRVEPVGRLDINTEGALLLTNDGPLAHKLTHPSTGVPKRYLAKVWKTPSERTIQRIQDGVMLEDGKTAPCKARVIESTDTGNTWVEITVTEGKNRLVRRLLAEVGHPVSKLRRESFATISIRGLERGEFRSLTFEEVARLRDLANGVAASAVGRKTRGRKIGFAKPDEEWMRKRLDRSSRKVNRQAPPRGGAAR